LQALCYLYAWDNGLPITNGLAQHERLRKYELDYSVQSLERLNAFLDESRQGGLLSQENYLDNPSEQNLFFLLGFYVGEVIGRALGQAPTWHRFEEFVQKDPAFNIDGPHFENTLVLTFPGHPQAGTKTFLPLVSLVSRAFDEYVDKSVLFSAGFMLPPGSEQEPGASSPLGPPPAPTWCIEAQGNLRARAWRLSVPEWLARDDLHRLIGAAPKLFASGRVVWGAIVQSNNDLADPLGDLLAAPGDIVYDPAGRVPWMELYEAGQRLQGLKGRDFDDPALTGVSKHLESETARVFGLAVPRSVMPYPLLMSSTWFQRSHLMGQMLAQPVLPIVISDELPGFAMPLPVACWPEEVKALWRPALESRHIPPDYIPPDDLAHLRPMNLVEEGFLYSRGGENDVPVNHEKAYAAWRKSADVDADSSAFRSLARMYEEGLGVPVDLGQALIHYERAMVLGEGGMLDSVLRVRKRIAQSKPGLLARLFGRS
jgi:hypothetical protein